MKFITLTLAALGVVGSIRLDQVHAPPKNIMSLIDLKIGDGFDDVIRDALNA